VNIVTKVDLQTVDVLKILNLGILFVAFFVYNSQPRMRAPNNVILVLSLVVDLFIGASLL
jgi:hypothetical protein